MKDIIAAVKWIESVIQIQSSSVMYNITWNDLSRCSKNIIPPTAKLSQSSGYKLQSLNQLTDFTNFNLILRDGSKECQEDPFLLAAATPCLQKSKERPQLGLMILCTNSKAWNGFTSGIDLFKHEILHSLGFGTFIPSKAEQRSPPSTVLSQRVGVNKFVKQDVHYMDFASEALKHARDYFGCSKMVGINADDEQKMHLDEYIFGNELMTPILSKGNNYFTKISASILENTFTGDKQWYKTNSFIVDQQTRSYWYGRNAGCEFLTQSCYEFGNKKSKSALSFPAFPFCTETNLKATVSGHKQDLCLGNGTEKVQLMTFCHMQSKTYDTTSITLNDMFPQTFKSKPLVYGSVNGYRGCPIISVSASTAEHCITY
ncbi:unnamed protein product [Bursaphelenchus okinawaensis]|uniref:Leishmanolysin-like peptidase n=1 Tax=Bursaphelenchus okinawaensis TaxID=465554 RepID=A0A811K472_9BILA|nr:unnamed protein product [Bursaphelenchus okinawaensis]CAG9091037.1 unnamed protein product [Bursaphelenchus okinawaensis]